MDEPTPQTSRARALIALGALGAFAVLVAVILAAGGSSDEPRDVVAAPEECIDAWNSDQQAVARGIHNYASHNYTRVQIAYGPSDVSELSADRVEDGGCVIVFAAQALDPEPSAAAEINLDGEWKPVSAGISFDRLGELQSDAIASANATLTNEGTVVPLDA